MSSVVVLSFTRILAGGFLVLGTIMDIRTKTLSRAFLSVSGGMALILFVLRIYMAGETLYTSIWCFLPGTFLLAIAFFSGEKVGYGDGITFLILGAVLGTRDCSMILMTALWCSFLRSVVLLAAGRVGVRSRIPFLPYVLTGFVIWEAVNVYRS